MAKHSTAQLLMMFLLGTGAWHGAVAAELNQQGAYQFEQITVLGSAQESEVFINPASVSVVGQEELNKVAPQSVASFLRNVPGVQIMEEGVERISIRGEDSRRVAILIDGQKLTDHTNYGQPLLIDPASIERIEVLRGSSSVVSGSRAIGGVVNIITKKGAAKPLEVTTQAGYFSATRGYRASTSLAGSQDGFDYRLGFSRSELADRDTPRGRLSPSETDDVNYSAHLGYTQGAHSVAVKALRYDVAANVYTNDTDFVIDLPKRELSKIAAFYEGDQLTEQLKKLKIDIYQQDIDREFYNNVTQSPAPRVILNVESLSKDKQVTRGINMQAELALIAGQDTVVGLEYEQDRIESNKDNTTKVTPPFGAPVITKGLGFDDASINTSSAFVQHAIPLGNEVTATLGARHYYVKAKHDESVLNNLAQPLQDNSDSHTVGAASLVWQPSDELVLRTNVSQGYVYPTLGQLFLTTTAGGLPISGNSELTPETSTTFEVGARYQDEGWLLDATTFYSRSKDYIASVSTGQRTATYRNLDQAKSYGLELLLEKELAAANLTPYLSSTIMRREIATPAYSTYETGTPTVFGQVGIKQRHEVLDWAGEVNLYVQGATKSKEANNVSGQSTISAGYGTVNVRYNLTDNQNANFGIELNNLLNKDYQPSGELLYGAERSVNAFASYKF